MSETLGGRMKEYERPWNLEVPSRSWSVLRVDVRAAHTFLRGAQKPFDPTFSAAMIRVAEALCREIQGARLAFTQSDECSVIYRAPSEKSESWFGGSLAKQISIGAALATATLATDPGIRGYFAGVPVFDARVFTLPDVSEVANYLIWRQRDAQRNSVSMVAQSVFSHRQLHKVNTGQMVEMLRDSGMDYYELPAGDRLGRETCKTGGLLPVRFKHKKTGEVTQTEVYRSWWETRSAPRYTGNPNDWPVVLLSEEEPGVEGVPDGQ